MGDQQTARTLSRTDNRPHGTPLGIGVRRGPIVVLDDAARSDERTAVRRWLATFPGLRLALLDDGITPRGTAVLAHSGDTRVRIVPRAIAGTVHDRWLYRSRLAEGP